MFGERGQWKKVKTQVKRSSGNWLVQFKTCFYKLLQEGEADVSCDRGTAILGPQDCVLIKAGEK